MIPYRIHLKSMRKTSFSMSCETWKYIGYTFQQSNIPSVVLVAFFANPMGVQIVPYVHMLGRFKKNSRF